MQSKIRKILASLSCLILFFSTACAPANNVKLEHTILPTSQSAPDFQLKFLNGKPVSLIHYRGKFVLIHFWASWCGACLYELETLNNLNKRLASNNFEILAIAVDDKWSSVKKVADKGQFSFPLMVDEGGTVRDRYRVSMIPESLLIDPEGNFIKFTAPQDNSLVLRTSGPQQWDNEAVVQYFSEIIK